MTASMGLDGKMLNPDFTRVTICDLVGYFNQMLHLPRISLIWHSLSTPDTADILSLRSCSAVLYHVPTRNTYVLKTKGLQ